jgi:hypothetical protein
MSNDPDDLAGEFLAHAQMNETTDYLQRGRELAHLSDADVADTWVTRFKAWFAEKSPAATRDMDDAAAELRLRDLPIPEERVQSEVSSLQAKIRKLGPDAKSASLDAAIDEFLSARAQPKN